MLGELAEQEPGVVYAFSYDELSVSGQQKHGHHPLNCYRLAVAQTVPFDAKKQHTPAHRPQASSFPFFFYPTSLSSLLPFSLFIPQPSRHLRLS